jgi:hypothetical protein
MKKSAYLFCALTFAGLAMLTSCDSRADHSGRIASLDSLSIEVEEAEGRFNKINAFNTDQFFKEIEADLSLIQDNFEGEMDRDMATSLASYRGITKLVKNFSKRHKRVKAEILRTKSQLLDLSQALSAGATQDSQGNQFTAAYVNKVFVQEKKVAENLIVEIDDMIERLKQAQERYDEIHPQVVPVIDSLQTEIEE